MDERRAENSGNPHIQQSGRDGRRNGLVFALLAVLAVGGLTFAETDMSWAQAAPQPPPPFPNMSTFKNGRITGVHGTTVQIDGKDFELQPDVVIKKPEGNEMEVHDIRRNALAQYHLKQGRIDMLVVILPD